MGMGEIRFVVPGRDGGLTFIRWNRRPNNPTKEQQQNMKSMKLLAYPLALVYAFLLASCASTGSSAKSGQGDMLYVCSCGADCKCKTVSTKPGKCGCGHELKAGNLKKVEGDVALLCGCDSNCKCTIDAKDPTKCGCGKPIQKVSLKGTGIYFCNCGGSCCNTVSDKPGKCKCGMDLKRAD
jgi:hypothetical protein